MKLSEVHEVKRKEIKRRFNLPADSDNVEVDEHFRPYHTVNGAKVMYPLKRTALVADGFHTHGGIKYNRK